MFPPLPGTNNLFGRKMKTMNPQATVLGTVVRRTLIRVGLPTLSLLLTSCVVPYPHRTHLRDGLSGTVLDMQNRKPIHDAEVRVDYPHESVSTTTDRNGDFRVRGRYIQHWARMLAPLDMSLLPARGGVSVGLPIRPSAINISKPGYRRLTSTIIQDGDDRITFQLDPE